MRSEWGAAAVALRKAKAKEQTTFVPLGEWRPDVAEFPVGNVAQYLRQADGVIATEDGYEPFNQSTQIGNDLPEQGVLGLTSIRAKDGEIFFIVGTDDNLYRLQSDGSWDTVTRLSGNYILSGTARWTFGQFENTILAHYKTGNMQKLDMATDTDFSDVSGNPPHAAHGLKFRSQYVLLNLSTGSADIIASRVGDISQWDGDGTGGSWSVSLESGGAIHGAYEVGGALYVFQENAINRIDFIGDQYVVNVQNLYNGHGCAVPWTFASWGDMAIYLAQDGLFMFTPATGARPVGRGKFDKTILEELRTQSGTYTKQIRSIIDPFRRIYILSYQRVDVSRMDIAFHYPSGYASRLNGTNITIGEGQHWALVPSSTQAPTTVAELLDTDGAQLALVRADTDNYPSDLTYRIMVHSSDTPYPMTLETQDCQFSPGRRVQVLKVEPVMDVDRAAADDEVSIDVRYRDVYGAADSAADADQINTQNNTRIWSRPQKSARFVSFRVTSSDVSRKVRGLWVTWRDAGKVL